MPTPHYPLPFCRYLPIRQAKETPRVGGGGFPSSSAVYERTCKNSPRPPPVLRKMRSPFALFVLVFAKVLLLPFLTFSEKALLPSSLFPLTFRWLELHFFAPWLRPPTITSFLPHPTPQPRRHAALSDAGCGEREGRGGEYTTAPKNFQHRRGRGRGKKELGRCLPGKIFAQGILYLRKTSTTGCIHFHHLFKTGQLRLSWQKVANSAPDTMASPLPPSPVKGSIKEEKDEAEAKRERGGGTKRQKERNRGGGGRGLLLFLLQSFLRSTHVGRSDLPHRRRLQVGWRSWKFAENKERWPKKKAPFLCAE